MAVPTFFIIGSPKCGTTALSTYLRGHPDVFMCTPKEPRYFDSDLTGGLLSFDKYLSLFTKAARHHKAIGEASATYLFSTRAVARICDWIRFPKFIVLLRNPIEFVQSFHAQQIMNGSETIIGFEAAWRAQEDRKQGRRIPLSCFEPNRLLYCEWAKFADQLERLFGIVDRCQVKIVLYDDLVRAPRQCYEDVLRFLHLPSDNRTVFPRYNQNRRVRCLLLQQVFGVWMQALARGKAKLGLTPFHSLYTLCKWNSFVYPRDDITDNFWRELVDVFAPDVARLSRLLARDLSAWRVRPRSHV